MAKEEFAGNLLDPRNNAYWLEPPFKMLMSNKGILPVLWEMFPDNPYLLPAYFEDDPRKKSIASNCVIKPLLSREGANVKIISGEITEITGGDYGKEGVIYQQFTPIKSHDGNFPVIGSWIVGQEPAGIGIREGDSLITTNKSRFVPHYIE
jgi:glutathionylspermidine synthase